jgi:hypothetical protein
MIVLDCFQSHLKTVDGLNWSFQFIVALANSYRGERFPMKVILLPSYVNASLVEVCRCLVVFIFVKE